jgi:anti-sigma factor RsiW
VPDHDVHRERVALAAAGALPPAEQPALEAHLAGCAACAQDLVELERVAAALRPPEGLEDAVVRAVARERTGAGRRRRAERLVAAAAAAVALLATGSLLPGALDRPAPREPVQLVAADDGTAAQAALVAHTWGTEVELVVEGLPAGRSFVVQLLDDAGRRYVAGTFLGVGDRPVVCDVNAAVLRERAVRLEVTDEGGEVVLAAQL